MRHFLVLADNNLEYLPDFQIERPQPTLRQVPLVGEPPAIAAGRAQPPRIEFSLTPQFPTGTMRFRVVDETAHILCCLVKNSLGRVEAFVEREEEPDPKLKAAALQHIQATIALLHC